MADTNGYEIDEATRKRWEMYDREMAELARFRARREYTSSAKSEGVE